MIKKRSYFIGLTLLVLVVSSGFITFKEEKLEGFHLSNSEVIKYHVPNEYENEEVVIPVKVPHVGKSFAGFAQKMAYKESRGILHLVNPYGYMGKYQFGRSTLRNVGVYDFKDFLKNPALQEEAIEALLSINKWELRKEIRNYSGRVINGIKITESGLLAAAHLAGASSVKTYLRSNGKNGFKDGFGTSLKSYIKRFNGYDTSNITPNRFAKVAI